MTANPLIIGEGAFALLIIFLWLYSVYWAIR
jgi:hypothetical protein